MVRNSLDTFLNEALPFARLVLCGGIVGASSAGLLTHYETLFADGMGAVLGALAVIMIKRAHIL